jgi:hypothetical protein
MKLPQGCALHRAQGQQKNQVITESSMFSIALQLAQLIPRRTQVAVAMAGAAMQLLQLEVRSFVLYVRANINTMPLIINCR